MKIRGQDGQHFNDGHDHRCPDCPPQVLHLPSELCPECGRCDDHGAVTCTKHQTPAGARRKGDK